MGTVAVVVPVKFKGAVEVQVPDTLPECARLTLARKIAVAQVLATCENEDNGECLEAACAEFIEETNGQGTEEEFDAATAEVASGQWSLDDDEED